MVCHLIKTTLKGTKIVVDFLPTLYSPAINGVKCNFLGRSLNFSYGGVMNYLCEWLEFTFNVTVYHNKLTIDREL